MKKKKLMLTLVICIITIITFGQTRTNVVLPKINAQVNSQLSKAKGWMLNPEGQWISRQNRIPVCLENQFKTLIDYEKNQMGLDNFISYQFRNIKIKDSTYLILIKKYKVGEYKYFEIKEGWYNYTNIEFYIFNKNEFCKFNSIIDDTINLIKIKVLYSSILFYKDTYISDIQKDIAKEQLLQGDNFLDFSKISKDKKEYLCFHIAPYKSKNIVQFQIYSVYGIYNIVPNLQWDKNVPYLTNDLFNHCYFEIDYLTFNNFISLSK